ncbi:uncharacterized protein BO66DRAFT_205707 [Aspergillus aculeatinus CBS 121060]|uniref:Uncharacterized protein n=1 Tax=Aspergillus aculeatinus CBS 121060 TaxID=1448322 RepID=A0ACD1HJH7_9EURO|nr:hypothetical protein BO66DRAFT_205707 [Aspergillus aculeatinus CBS 121060]RAH73769.1 hypothetical protein BO66DRAFT_205707 [Aspergillus aculeatinus CBS 121060]
MLQADRCFGGCRSHGAMTIEDRFSACALFLFPFFPFSLFSSPLASSQVDEWASMTPSGPSPQLLPKHAHAHAHDLISGFQSDSSCSYNRLNYKSLMVPTLCRVFLILARLDRSSTTPKFELPYLNFPQSC